ncbi:MAG: NADH-quinone oxidoreductase subunit L [Thermoleophilia bacterium]|nr:NADH-quinone oxidoreductase subunit L [Thermoleophilia bacterium]
MDLGGRHRGALALALVVFLAVRGQAEVSLHTIWLQVGGLQVPFSLRADGLQAVMAVVVAAVAFLVHLFSVGYMHGDRDVVVYFAELSLFTGAMLLLVLADNFFLLYVAWELVGASSYLLISYYYERPAAASAGKKAFLTTRIGDVGLLVGLFAIVWQTGSLEYRAAFATVESPGFSGAWATVIPLLIFAGAVGKSAQFPLHVWLPDAMEGPTPVSALIHAATMVAAGVYLVARTFPIFAAAPAALDVVAYLGAFTALMAATIAVTQRDIKRVLAYSTISQLGFMMAALGAGAPAVGIFHLFTHAWFKALLFLAAGSVIHATGRQLVEELGGLARRMPVTAWAFVAGALALGGVPPFAGFWSKEEILARLADTHPVLLVALLLASFLTALYIFRLVFLVFFGPEPEGAAKMAAAGHGTGGEPVRESGLVMTIPLGLLALGAVVAGFFGAGFLGQPLQGFLKLGETGETTQGAPLWLTVLAIAVALGGVALAWGLFGRRAPGADADAVLRARAPGTYRVVAEGYRLDAFYHAVLIGPYLVVSRFFARALDEAGIDWVPNALARLAPWLGGRFRRLQTGEVRDYLTAMIVGAVLVAAFVLGAR